MTFETANSYPPPSKAEMAPLIEELRKLVTEMERMNCLGDAMAHVCHLGNIERDFDSIVVRTIEKYQTTSLLGVPSCHSHLSI